MLTPKDLWTLTEIEKQNFQVPCLTVETLLEDLSRILAHENYLKTKFLLAT
jgi:hypothetical protein